MINDKIHRIVALISLITLCEIERQFIVGNIGFPVIDQILSYHYGIDFKEPPGNDSVFDFIKWPFYTAGAALYAIHGMIFWAIVHNFVVTKSMNYFINKIHGNDC